jgi:hypothetical protein
MNRFNYLSIKTVLILLIVFLFVVPALADVRLPHIIGSGMVVQREMGSASNLRGRRSVRLRMLTAGGWSNWRRSKRAGHIR